MLNKERHQLIMGQVLRDIYSDISIASLLGFKGGTCTYFFYGLPRFSVDLDFDLLVIDKKVQESVFETVTNILSRYGQVKNQYMKRFTIFALLSYGEDDHNIKVEINIRGLVDDIHNHYLMKEYLGISMLVAKQDYLFASKLLALTLRKETAMRDIYDIHYFAENHWDINIEIIKEKTGKDIKDYLPECITLIEGVKDSQVMRGLGELISSDKEKAWIKAHLKNDTIFMLKNYLSILK